MRVAVIGDLHLGKTLYGFDLTPHVRQAMHEFFELCRTLKVGAAVCLGDVYDKPAPSVSLQKLVIQWANEFERACIDLHLLAGNHDVTSNAFAPTALESIRVAAPFQHVHVIDRPTVVRDVGTMLPFPSPGIYESHEHYVAAVNRLHHHEPFAFAHLNVSGAKLGEQEFVYRGADHALPEGPWRAVLNGHIHKPQRLGAIWIVGAAERTSFSERNEPRHFVLLRQGRVVRYTRPTALRLVQVEPDVSGWAAGRGDVPTTEEVAASIAPKARGALVKVSPFVDDRSVVDWPAVEERLLAAGALSVFVAPAVRLQKAVAASSKSVAALDPAAAAARFIGARVHDKQERSRLLQTFKRLQREVDHDEREVRG